MGKLQNKRALVTGSSSGIGAGVALAFAREGADVVINYPTPQQQEAAETIAEQVRAARTKEQGHSSRRERSRAGGTTRRGQRRALGGIDILVNNAGIAGTNNVEDMSDR